MASTWPEKRVKRQRPIGIVDGPCRWSSAMGQKLSIGQMLGIGEKLSIEAGDKSSDVQGQRPPITPNIDFTGHPLPASYDAGFVNVIIKQTWPSFNAAVTAAVTKQLLPLVRRHLKALQFISIEVEQFTLGTTALKVIAMEVYPKEQNSNQIMVDVEFEYHGDHVLEGRLLAVPFGVKDLKVSGRLRFLLGPLLPVFPIYGAVSIFFCRAPEISFDLTGLANVLDMPLIRGVFRNAVNEVIAKEIVLPNRKVIILDKKAVDEDSLKHPPPKGVLSITVVAVRHVDDTDWVTKPDIFVKLQIGSNKFRTKTVNDVTSAVFNESFEAMLTEYEDRELTISVFDRDVIGADPLGTAKVILSHAVDGNKEDLNLPLTNSQKGTVRLKVAWKEVSLVAANELLSPKVPSTGCQLILMDLKECKHLPTIGMPQYFLRVHLGKSVEESKIATITGTNKLSFNDHLRFLSVYSPETIIKFRLMDSSSDEEITTVGTFSVPLKDVLEADGSRLDHHFCLDGHKKKAVHVIILMRVLMAKPIAERLIDSRVSQLFSESIEESVSGKTTTDHDHGVVTTEETAKRESRGSDEEKDHVRPPLLAFAMGETQIGWQKSPDDFSPSEVTVAVDGHGATKANRRAGDEKKPSLLELATGQVPATAAQVDKDSTKPENPTDLKSSQSSIFSGTPPERRDLIERDSGIGDTPDVSQPTIIKTQTMQKHAELEGSSPSGGKPGTPSDERKNALIETTF